MSEVLQKVWLEGYIAGIKSYAWWKDGVQYVGTCGRTLAEAIAEAEKDFAVEKFDFEVSDE
jgi:hypothetical protein